MRLPLAAALMLLATGTAMAADVYDAVFVTNTAVCDQAGADDMAQVLFDLEATALVPMQGIWSRGEMVCTLRNIDTDLSPIADGPDEVEIYATARCHAYDIDFIDPVVISAYSQGINAENGDDGIDHPPGEKVQLYSMRADLRAEGAPDYDNYAGIYTRCEALTAEDFAWPE